MTEDDSNKTLISNDFDKLNVLRKSLEDLEPILDQEMKMILKEKLRQYEKDMNLYVTKPFRTCESMGSSLYDLMKSLSKRVK